MKYVNHLDSVDFEKNLFGRETIKLSIPKCTNALIVTTVSDSKDDATAITTITYDFKDIEKMLIES